MARDGSGPFGTLEALKSDPSSSAATLEAVAEKHIAEFTPDLIRASQTFVAVVAGQQSLAAELFGRPMVEAKAREWFATYARRSGQPEGAATRQAPKGHSRRAAPETISVGGLSPCARDGQTARALDAEPINGGGQPGRAKLATHSLPPTVDPKPSDGGLSSRAAQANVQAPPTARPQSVTDIKAAGQAFKQIARTVLDSVRAPDGTALGDIRYSQIARYRSESLSLAAVLDRIQLHAQPSPDNPDPKIREMISEETAERFMGVRNAA